MTGFIIQLKHSRGLTLLELVVALALFAILILAITRVFLNVSDVQQRVYQDQNIESDLRYGIGVLVDEAKKGKPHSSDVCQGTTLTGCTGKYFCMLGGSSDKVFLRDKSDNCVQYYLSNGQLMVQRGAQIYTLTSSDIVLDILQFDVNLVDAPQSGNSLMVFAKARTREVGGPNILYQTAVTNNP